MRYFTIQTNPIVIIYVVYDLQHDIRINRERDGRGRAYELIHEILLIVMLLNLIVEID